MMLLLVVVICLLVQVSSGIDGISSSDVTCSHPVIMHHEVMYDVDLGEHHVVRRRSPSQPLRIHVHLDRSVHSLSLGRQDVLLAEVKRATEFWQRTLSVRRSSSVIRLRRQCDELGVKYHHGRSFCARRCAEVTMCGDVIVPDGHLEGCRLYDWISGRPTSEAGGMGVGNADFILYVAAMRSQRCVGDGRTVAYAAHCQQEQALDRPVAGYFSICPGAISDSRQERLQLLSTVKHEVVHALGFTASLFAFYRDRHGRPLTPRSPNTGKPLVFNIRRLMYDWSDRVVKEIVRTDWKILTGHIDRHISIVVTPTVKAEVRRHFDCSSLEGAELEDQGIDGTALTHWEKRVFENEAMTGTYTQDSVVSRITLAMLEDTGWYAADYSQAGDYEWGRGLGCEFVTKSCYHWISSRLSRNDTIHPYCRRVRQRRLWTDCSQNRRSVAVCNLVRFNTSLPMKYQYFTTNQLPGVPTGEENRYAGSVMLADYCPYLQEFLWTGQSSVRGSSCVSPANHVGGGENFFVELYGEGSRCVRHAAPWHLYRCGTVSVLQHGGSGCYGVTCRRGSGLVISVGNRSYPCPHLGYVHRVSAIADSTGYLHKGSIVCPDCYDVCPALGYECSSPESRPLSLDTPTSQLIIPCSTWRSSAWSTAITLSVTLSAFTFS